MVGGNVKCQFSQAVLVLSPSSGVEQNKKWYLSEHLGTAVVLATKLELLQKGPTEWDYPDTVSV
jgi:hypothetical protein